MGCFDHQTTNVEMFEDSTGGNLHCDAIIGPVIELMIPLLMNLFSSSSNISDLTRFVRLIHYRSPHRKEM